MCGTFHLTVGNIWKLKFNDNELKEMKKSLGKGEKSECIDKSEVVRPIETREIIKYMHEKVTINYINMYN